MTRITHDEFLYSNGPKSGRVESIQFPGSFFVRGDKGRTWIAEGSTTRTDTNTFQNFGALLYEYPNGGLRDAPKKSDYEQAINYFRGEPNPRLALAVDNTSHQHAARIIEKLLSDTKG